MRRRNDRDDDGFTLVELIVYSVLLILIMGIAATLFIQMLTVQRDVTAMADANNTAQVTFAELERDLRNAGWANVSHSGDLLVMRTRVATAGADNLDRCVGYYVDEAAGALRRTTSQAGTSAALAASSPGALSTATATWPVSRDGMSAVGSGRVFGPADQTYAKGGLISLSLEAATIEGRDPVVLDKSIALRQSDITMGCS
ncbi:PilW family protein [Demequina muriae]|uniref:Prepilin-type N-terminal cleavage/methylation domain-containing protein n=1 Tax=Demequina muriae TaxID=3051664 RepID=A0ABT8GJR0_9MICO|nr:hypothetical protein [Demequina sp. EGI L300058]MDN4481675.1 hypothetical protein [Demequina sp. EGI L300058]